MGKKYAVWKIGKKDSTKGYVYATTHREARSKYAKKHKTTSAKCDSQKV